MNLQVSRFHTVSLYLESARAPTKGPPAGRIQKVDPQSRNPLRSRGGLGFRVQDFRVEDLDSRKLNVGPCTTKE